MVGAIQFSNQQEQLRNTFEKANVAYVTDADGNVRAASESIQRAAEALAKSGVSAENAATILGDADVQGAFGDIDAANAQIAANQNGFNGALDDFDATITGIPLAPELAGTPIPIGPDGQPLQGALRPAAAQAESALENPTHGAFDSDNPLVQALRPVGTAATALANLNDRFSGLAEAIVVAGQAVVGGGGVGQVVIRLGKAVAGQGLDYISGQAHDFVVNKVDSYLRTLCKTPDMGQFAGI